MLFQLKAGVKGAASGFRCGLLGLCAVRAQLVKQAALQGVLSEEGAVKVLQLFRGVEQVSAVAFPNPCDARVAPTPLLPTGLRQSQVQVSPQAFVPAAPCMGPAPTRVHALLRLALTLHPCLVKVLLA